jgi:hypothetical protein
MLSAERDRKDFDIQEQNRLRRRHQPGISSDVVLGKVHRVRERNTAPASPYQPLDAAIISCHVHIRDEAVLTADPSCPF